MTPPDILRALAGAAAGAVITWGATGLGLSARVQAIEAGQARIEQRLDQLLTTLTKHKE